MLRQWFADLCHTISGRGLFEWSESIKWSSYDNFKHDCCTLSPAKPANRSAAYWWWMRSPKTHHRSQLREWLELSLLLGEEASCGGNWSSRWKVQHNNTSLCSWTWTSHFVPCWKASASPANSWERGRENAVLTVLPPEETRNHGRLIGTMCLLHITGISFLSLFMLQLIAMQCETP